MDHVDQLKRCVQELILLVQLKEVIDVKSEHVQPPSKTVLLLMDVVMNIHKDVQKLVNVQKVWINVKNFMQILLYLMVV